MDHAVLVDLDLKTGQRVIDKLDAHDIEIDVAVLATLEEYYHPRLILAAKWLEAEQPIPSYKRLGEVLRKIGAEQYSLEFRLMALNDPFIVDLRRQLARYDDPTGLRLDGRSFDGKYVEDGYVYRVK